MWSRLIFSLAMISFFYPKLMQNAPTTMPNFVMSPLQTGPSQDMLEKFIALPISLKQNQRPSTDFLNNKSFELSPQALNYLRSVINYAGRKPIAYNHLIGFIDYSKAANEKRFWIFDLDNQALLQHTYVSHGLKSGSLNARFFSNRFDSKASSIGVYKTDKPYYGRHGLSLKLIGLEPGFNDNADSRAIVMHGAWYVEEPFISKYGRAGRSWGCPAVSDKLTTPIINLIKENSLLVIYYPSPSWAKRSRFLSLANEATQVPTQSFISPISGPELREDILLSQWSKSPKNTESEAILVLPAQRYAELFQKPCPLNRMLRRQIEDQEYIALSNQECEELIHRAATEPQQIYKDLAMVKPEIVMSHGYYATEMRKLDLGKLQQIRHEFHTDQVDGYRIDWEKQSGLSLKTSHKFIRWLGL